MTDLSSIPDFTVENWHWIVGGDERRFYSTAARAYVASLPKGAMTSRVATEADLWTYLAQHYPEGLPAGDSVAQGARKERMLSLADKTLFQIAFRQENRLRVLEGKAEITAAQFRNAVKATI